MSRYFRFSPRGFRNEVYIYVVADDEAADDWSEDFEKSLSDFDAERFVEIEADEARRVGRASWNTYGYAIHV